MMLPVIQAVTVLAVAAPAPVHAPIASVAPAALSALGSGAVTREVICHSTRRGDAWVTRCRVLVQPTKPAAVKAALAQPAAKSPKARTPKAKSPKAKTPKAKSPKAKTPKAKTPKAKSPKAKTPKAKTTRWVIIVPPPAPQREAPREQRK